MFKKNKYLYACYSNYPKYSQKHQLFHKCSHLRKIPKGTIHIIINSSLSRRIFDTKIERKFLILSSFWCFANKILCPPLLYPYLWLYEYIYSKISNLLTSHFIRNTWLIVLAITPITIAIFFLLFHSYNIQRYCSSMFLDKSFNFTTDFLKKGWRNKVIISIQ